MFRKQLTAVYISKSALGICRVSSAGKFGGKRPPKIRFIDLVEGERGDSFLDPPENGVAALKRLLKRHRIRGGDAALAISTHGVIFRTAELPVMGEEEFRGAAEMGGLWEPFSWAPVPADEYLVDFIRYPQTPGVTTMDACLVAAPRGVVLQQLDIVKQAGLNPVVVDVANLSAARALLRWHRVAGLEGDAMQQFLLYQAAGDGHHVTFIDRDTPELSELFVSESLNGRLNSDVELEQDELQQLVSTVASQLQGILQPHTDNSRESEERGKDATESSIEEQSEQQAPPPAALPVFLLTDLPAFARSWEGFTEGLSAQGIAAHQPERFFVRSRVLNKALSRFGNSEAVASLVGLSLRKFDRKKGSSFCLHGAEGINLLPGYRALRKGRKKRFLINTTTLLLGLPTILLMLFLHYQQWMEQTVVSSRLVTYEQLNRAISSNREKLATSTQTLLELQTLLDVAERAGNNHQESYHVLVHVSRSIPLGVRLIEIHSADGVSVTIRGKAGKDSQILEMVDLMRRDGLFSRVSLRTIQQEKAEAGSRRSVRKEGREFILHCVVSPTFDSNRVAPEASLLFYRESLLAHNIWLKHKG